MEVQSWIIKKPGSLKRLEITTHNLESPSDNEITIAVKTIGLNYADIFAIIGLYKAAPKKDLIPGLEFAGEVISVGDKVKRFKVGDRVMGVSRFGAYTSHLNINEMYCDPVPVAWSYEQAAAFPVQVLTAYYALISLGNLQKGQTVLIHSAAGGVGLLANRIAKKFNAYTIGVVGSDFKIPFILKEGYDKGIVRSSNFKKDLTDSLGGRDLKLILETTGSKYMKWSYELMAPMGRMVTYGSAQFTPSGSSPNFLTLIKKFLFRPKFDPLTMITENKSIMAFNLIWLYEKSDLMREMMKAIMDLHLDAPHVGNVFDFKEIPEALELFKSGKTIGKVIIRLK